MELKTYLTILARRWQIILLIVLVSIGVSLFATRYVSYEAETKLQVITPVGGSFDYIYYETTFANRLMNTYAQIATSNQLKSELKAKLNLAVLPNISIKTIPDSEIIQIIVESRDPALAARTANALAELIISRQDNVVTDSANSEEINILNERKAELEKSLTAAQQEYDSLVQDYSQTAARIAVIERTIQVKEATYQNNMAQSQQVLLSGVPGRATALNEEAERLAKELEVLNKQYEELSTDSNKYSQQLLMVRQTIQNDQTAYASLLARYDSALNAQHREERSQNILIVSPAVEPSEPTLSRFFIVLLGLMCGLIGGIVLAFVFDSLDTRIISSEQVTAITAMPVLGGYPHFSRQKHQKDNVLPALYGDYLIMQKKLFQILQSRNARMLMVTSPNPMEGKSTISASLAASLAENRCKVLLIDANLRRPQQHILHSVSEGQDLHSFLNGESVKLEDVIRKDVKPGVDLLPCFPGDDDPAQLLRSPLLQVLFEKAKAYDFILIDVPALLSVPDAYTLTDFVDGILIVIRRGRTTIGDIKSTHSYLEDINSKLLGIVINDVPLKMDVHHSYETTGWLPRIRARAERFILAHF
jgi:capsular exopolysaccharide synthesis family protein